MYRGSASVPGGGGGGGCVGYSSHSVVGMCCPVLQILTLFQTKTCHFRYPFSDLTKIYLQRPKLCHHRLVVRTPTTPLIYFVFFLFLSYSFGVEKDKYVYTRSWFPWKPYPISDHNGQNLYPFSDQNGLKTIPFGAAHTDLYSWYRVVTPPPPSRGASVHLVTACYGRLKHQNNIIH